MVKSTVTASKRSTSSASKKYMADFYKNPYNFDYLKTRGWYFKIDQKKKVNAGTHVVRYIPVNKVIQTEITPKAQLIIEKLMKQLSQGHCLAIVECVEIPSVGYLIQDPHGQYSFEAYHLLHDYEKIPVLLKKA